MTGVQLAKTHAEADDDNGVYYPSSDGKPMAETPAHVNLLIGIISALAAHFRPRPEVLVAGNIFWYYEEGNAKARRSPDVMVVKGVAPRPVEAWRSFRSWRERADPCFVLEVTSRKTRRVDLEEKYPLYERLGVKEYFLFDPLHEHLFPALRGFRLRGGRYRELTPDDEGGIVSRELGVRFRPEGAWLRMTHAGTGEAIQTLDDALAKQAEQDQRIAELTAENERLRQRRPS